MKVRTRIDIDATADDVWQVIGPGFTRVGDWVAAIATSEPTGEGGPTGAPPTGRTCTVATVGFDRISERLTDYDPAARQVGYRLAGGMPSFVTDAGNTWQARPLPDGRTEFTMDADATLSGIGRLFSPLLRHYLARVGRRTSRDLKVYLETGAPSRAKAISSHSAGRTTLDRVVLINAAFSAASGVALAVASTWWSTQFGTPWHGATAAGGVILVWYALLLGWASGRGVTGEAGRVIATLDALWVLGNVAALAVFGSRFTAVGLVAAIMSDLAVAALGILQWRTSSRVDTMGGVSAQPSHAVGPPTAVQGDTVRAVEHRPALAVRSSAATSRAPSGWAGCARAQPTGGAPAAPRHP